MANELEFTERLKRLVIIGMMSDDELMERLVLKGGNLLDIAYGVSTRASVDIDFSVDGDLSSISDLEGRIQRTLTKTFHPEQLMPFDLVIKPVPPNISEDMKSFWGGHKIDFKIIDIDKYNYFRDDIEQMRRNAVKVGKQGSTKFRIDISNHEYCGAKEARIIDGYTVFGYTPYMFLAEKLRAICQQMPKYSKLMKSHPSARARDFVDICGVVDKFDLSFKDSNFHHTLERTFLAKKVPLCLLGEIIQYQEFHRDSFRAVEDTVKAGVKLASFDAYFDIVTEGCRWLEPLWNK